MRAFRIAYDGRQFRGFQRQPDVPTVEDTLLGALRRLGVCGDGIPPGYAAAGRTDAGVSALAQTVSFEAPEWCSPGAINSELPAAVRAWASADVPADFHAQHDAVRREYVYHLYAPATSDESTGAPVGSAESAPAVDDERAREAVARLSGEHDFHNLTSDDRGTVRDLTVDAERDGDFLVITVAAGGFARELVRRLVTLLRAVASGTAPLSKIDRVLGPEPIDGPEGVGPAPPTPLVLVDVVYPGVEFDADADAAAATRRIFADRRVAALGTARAAGTIEDGIGRRE